ncbi:hypothetical protein FN846DRAFT_886829 [Sphaerosporella brunnea]|uniref:SH3 domain-containing protein n=1 Tax=Sphaerosporella brunnea TaxID=1250544 RepID=A0A5J5F8G1_9PEZI|nr:hypothetical protein FN846DRAFT_886829 [Sphaerosporella brunnea]
MDGISAAASSSVVGLLQVATKVVAVLSTMIDAPSLARNVLTETNSLIAIFHQLQTLLSNLSAGHRPGNNEERKSMLQVDQIVAALTGCVYAFSELEECLDSVTISDNYDDVDDERRSLTLWDRARWAEKERDLRRLLGNLEMHKSSLKLMLTIYNCESIREARQCMEKLSQLMHTIRMERASGQAAPLDTTATISRSFTDPCVTSTPTLAVPTGPRTSSRGSRIFERVLNESRVYLKASRNKSTPHSFMSFTRRDSNLSQLTEHTCLSGMAVVHLPYLAQPVIEKLNSEEQGHSREIGSEPYQGKQRTPGYPYLARTISGFSSSAAAKFRLPFEENEVLELSYTFGRSWWHARRSNGETGIVHAKVLEFLDPIGQPGQRPPPPPPPPPSRRSAAVQPRFIAQPYFVKALCSYKAERDDGNELSFKKDEVLEIVKVSRRWWQARSESGETGIVPSNFLISLQPQEEDPPWKHNTSRTSGV